MRRPTGVQQCAQSWITVLGLGTIASLTGKLSEMWYLSTPFPLVKGAVHSAATMGMCGENYLAATGSAGFVYPVFHVPLLGWSCEIRPSNPCLHVIPATWVFKQQHPRSFPPRRIRNETVK